MWDHIVRIRHGKINLPHTESFGQGETEDKSSEDTQHRSGPADEESGPQLKPEGVKWTEYDWTSFHLNLLLLIPNTYFWATNMGSKKSVVIL